jgi:presequence protease
MFMSFNRVAQARLSDSHIQVFRHPSGLRHVHLEDPQAPPTFMIAFPTVPVANDGRSHVLEHLVLSGSRRFPVHDLFSRAQERSLASYMNALTGEMETCYPFVTPQLEDFAQLLDVYLDVVFHPCLMRADFLAEGFRRELDEQGAVTFQGVVFNEMSGYAEDPDHHTQVALRRFLYPDSALGLESGGDPLGMTDLTHEQVQALHQHSYHPALAVVFTAGPDAVRATTQAKLMSVLAEAWPAAPLRPAMPRLNWHGSKRHTVALPVTEDMSAGRDHEWLVAWPLGSLVDGEGLHAWIRYQLFHAMWFDESSAFMQAHQTHQWGRLGSMAGIHNIGLDQWLVLHFQGLSEHELMPLEELVRDHVRRLATEGVPAPFLQRYRRDVDLEVRQRGNQGPQGPLNGLFEALTPLLYDPQLPLRTLVNLLDVRVTTEQWDSVLTDPDEVQALARLLQEATTELVLTGVPNAAFHAERQARLDALQGAAAQAIMQDPALRTQLEADAQLLNHRDTTLESADVLPAFPVTQIAPDAPAYPTVDRLEDGLLWIPVDQHGLMRVTLAVDLSGVAPTWFNACSALLGVLLPGMGNARQGPWAQAISKRQQAGLNIEGWLRTEVRQSGTPVLMGAVQGLTRPGDARALAEALVAMVQTPDWSDPARIQYLIQSECDSLNDRLVAMGDQWMTAQLEQGVHPGGDWQHDIMGLPRAHFWWRLAADMKRDPAQAIAFLQQAWQHLAAAPWHVVLMGDTDALACGSTVLGALRAGGWTPAHPSSSIPSSFEHWAPTPRRIALVSPQSTSGYHGCGWRGPTTLDEDSADLLLLGHLLSQEELLPRIRTQGGAYGSHATWERGVFLMTSWNDPRLSGTLNDFEAARQRAMQPFDTAALAHAQRLVFQSLDSPRRPFQRATLALNAHWRGDVAADRQRWRDAFLSATPARVCATAHRWLSQPALTTTVFIGARQKAEAKKRDLMAVPLLTAA